jgi:hypothetical protein
MFIMEIHHFDFLFFENKSKESYLLLIKTYKKERKKYKE